MMFAGFPSVLDVWLEDGYAPTFWPLLQGTGASTCEVLAALENTWPLEVMMLGGHHDGACPLSVFSEASVRDLPTLNKRTASAREPCRHSAGSSVPEVVNMRTLTKERTKHDCRNRPPPSPADFWLALKALTITRI